MSGEETSHRSVITTLYCVFVSPLALATGVVHIGGPSASHHKWDLLIGANGLLISKWSTHASEVVSFSHKLIACAAHAQ